MSRSLDIAKILRATEIDNPNNSRLITTSANFIGMDRTALHRKMKDLNIMPNERYRNIIGY